MLFSTRILNIIKNFQRNVLPLKTLFCLLSNSSRSPHQHTVHTSSQQRQQRNRHAPVSSSRSISLGDTPESRIEEDSEDRASNEAKDHSADDEGKPRFPFPIFSDFFFFPWKHNGWKLLSITHRLSFRDDYAEKSMWKLLSTFWHLVDGTV